MSATVGENTPRTISFAREVRPVGEESIVISPTKITSETGQVTLTFESINWTKASDLTRIHANPQDFLRPSIAYLYPFDYKGTVPPNEESIADWQTTHNISNGHPYFKTITPKATSKQSPYDVHTVELPSDREYIVAVVAGARHEAGTTKLHPRDPYDNFDVTVESDAFAIAADVSKPVAETVVLGDEFSKVTQILPDGRIVASGAIPGTANSNKSDEPYPRLSGRVYAKYHPQALDSQAPANQTTRTFEVTPGKTYSFNTVLSGIDLGGVITIQNGDQTIKIDITPSKITYTENNTIVAIDDFSVKKRVFQKAHVLNQPRELNDKPFGLVLSHKQEADEAMPQGCVLPFQEDTTYIPIQDSEGNWYLAKLKRKGNDPYQLKTIERVDEKLDATQVLLGYQTGSIKTIDWNFKAESAAITITFTSYPGSNTTVAGTLDELRFDRIRLEEVK
ncbi:hypothetical protein K1X76_11385 [bacterium]|nr:hypothetical protein [bacterium]